MSMRLLEQALEPQEELPANQNLCYWIVDLGAHPVCCKLLWFCFVSDKLGHPTILTPPPPLQGAWAFLPSANGLDWVPQPIHWKEPDSLST